MAHGGRISGFHPDLPEAPARLGADIVISSTHKLAGALTQASMLHLGDGPFADRLEPLIARVYTMTASTSGSAILMSSLDLARRALATGADTIASRFAVPGGSANCCEPMNASQ